MPAHASPRSTTERVLDLLRTERALSRVEIAARAGVTQATVTNVVRPLVDAGLVREGERQMLDRGAPRRMLELVADAWYSVGVQLDRTTTTVLVTDFTGTQVAKASLRGSGGDGPEPTLARVADHVDGLLHSAAVPRARVLGVGLVTHGPQDRDRGMLLTAQPTVAWQRFPLTGTLSKSLHLPVSLENDATAAAVGEQWLGQTPAETFGLIYLSTGIGGAVVVGATPYRGRTSNAVEIGHIALVPGGQLCVCGERGCVQAEAGPHAVARAALAQPALATRLRLSGNPDEALADFERIARAARSGDADATALLEASAARLADAAVVLFNLFDVDTLVLAGPAFATAGPLYSGVIQPVLQRRALHRDLSTPRVRVSAHTSTAAALGGALHVLRTMTPLARPHQQQRSA